MTAGRDTLALCYHAVSDDWPAPLAVAAAELESQLRALLERGYKPVTFSRAVLDPPGGRTLAVSFDDAYRSVYELAAPLLDALAVPATVFVPTAFAGNGDPMSWPGIDRWVEGPHQDELVPMSWEQLRDLAERGWEIGSHTRTHPRLTELADDALVHELAASRSDCERFLDRPCTSVAYPYGDEDARVAAAARESGYRAGAALPVRFRRGDPLRFPRIGIYRPDSYRRFRLKTSARVRALRGTAAWSALSAARRHRP